MTYDRRKALLVFALLPTLTGCFRTTRSVMQTHPPAQVLSGSLDTLVQATTERYDHIRTLKASVEVTTSRGGGKQGKVVEYISFNGYILFRKPDDLHFLGLLPIAHTTMVDMVTDGKTFTVVIPPRSQAITGTNDNPGTSTNPLENLRPQFVSDSLLIKSAQPGELVSVVSDERIYQPDPTRKYVVDEPEYDLGIYRTVPGSSELKTQRVIHVGRSNLLPYQQDIYDGKGQLATVASYDDYKVFGETTFPSVITIRRPLDQLSLKLVITQLAVNQDLDDDQFTVTVKPSYKVQHLQ